MAKDNKQPKKATVKRIGEKSSGIQPGGDMGNQMIYDLLQGIAPELLGTQDTRQWKVGGKTYDNRKDAQAAADKINERRFGTSGGDGDDDGVDPSVRATRNYNQQRRDAWQDFRTLLDNEITTALAKNPSENKYDAGRYGSGFLSEYLQPLKSELDVAVKASDDPKAQYDFGTVLNDDAIADILDTIVGDTASTKKTSMGKRGWGFDEKTGQSQFAADKFDTSLDDALIADILDTQGGEATRALDRALSYGQISQDGYNAALQALDEQRIAGQGTLTGYGDAILGGYQSDIDKQIGDIYSNINDLSFGDKYNLQPEVQGIRKDVNKKLTGFEGDFLNTVGNEQFFNIGDLLAEGSKGSGIFDPIKEGSAGGFFGKLEGRQDEENKPRGLGSYGSF